MEETHPGLSRLRKGRFELLTSQRADVEASSQNNPEVGIVTHVVESWSAGAGRSAQTHTARKGQKGGTRHWVGAAVAPLIEEERGVRILRAPVPSPLLLIAAYGLAYTWGRLAVAQP